MVVLDISIVTWHSQHAARSAHVAERFRWVLNAYTLTFAGSLLLGGRALTCGAVGACS